MNLKALISIPTVFIVTILLIKVIHQQDWSTAAIFGLGLMVYCQVFAIPLAITRGVTSKKSHEMVNLWAKATVTSVLIMGIIMIPSTYFPSEQAGEDDNKKAVTESKP